MTRGFTGIRLLLVFVGVNTILFLMLVSSMVSEHPWLARVLPGQFGVGVNSSGYWVFFSLVLLVNAITVLLAGFALVFPALTNNAPVDERRLTRLLLNRSGINDEARASCLVTVREETTAFRQQVELGRVILLSGIVFLTLAFMAVSLSMAHAIPWGHMFESHGVAIANSTIGIDATWRFTADQITGALLLGVPEIYHWHFIHLVNNIDDPFYSTFVLAFRTMVGFVIVVVVLTLLRGGRGRVELPKSASAKPTPSGSV
jgi:hypothetical protein